MHASISVCYLHDLSGTKGKKYATKLNIQSHIFQCQSNDSGKDVIRIDIGF